LDVLRDTDAIQRERIVKHSKDETPLGADRSPLGGQVMGNDIARCHLTWKTEKVNERQGGTLKEKGIESYFSMVPDENGAEV